MAFEVKTKVSGEDICYICRKKFKDGRAIINTDYHEHTNIMCKNCFKLLYRNRKAKRTAGITDDSANIAARIRPAPVLEKPLFSKRKFFMGYEYTMHDITEMRIVVRALVCGVMSGILLLSLKIYSGFMQGELAELCSIAAKTAICAGAAVISLRSIMPLIKGLFYGMGHIRRLLLTAELIVFAVIAVKVCPNWVADIITLILLSL